MLLREPSRAVNDNRVCLLDCVRFFVPFASCWQYLASKYAWGGVFSSCTIRHGACSKTTKQACGFSSFRHCLALLEANAICLFVMSRLFRLKERNFVSHFALLQFHGNSSWQASQTVSKQKNAAGLGRPAANESSDELRSLDVAADLRIRRVRADSVFCIPPTDRISVGAVGHISRLVIRSRVGRGGLIWIDIVNRPSCRSAAGKRHRYAGRTKKVQKILHDKKELRLSRLFKGNEFFISDSCKSTVHIVIHAFV
jgi:hypothetical protein